MSEFNKKYLISLSENATRTTSIDQNCNLAYRNLISDRAVSKFKEVISACTKSAKLGFRCIEFKEVASHLTNTLYEWGEFDSEVWALVSTRLLKECDLRLICLDFKEDQLYREFKLEW